MTITTGQHLSLCFQKILIIYSRCFPPESDGCNIHKVISFVHEKVKNALEVVSREEKNKSLQSLFKELNDHTTNSFEFGKSFLAYLIYPDRNAGNNLTSDPKMDGKTIETGKLHRILEQSTEVVFKTYVDDMSDSIANQKSPELKALENKSSNVLMPGQIEALQRRDEYHYTISVADYEESLVKGVVYLIEICDPKGHKWIVRKSYADCEALHAILLNNIEDDEDLETFVFPPKISKMFPKKDDYLQLCGHLTKYYQTMFDALSRFNKTVTDAISSFVEVKYMIIPVNRSAKRAEDMPNLFMKMKKEFSDQLVARKSAAEGNNGSLNFSSIESDCVHKFTCCFYLLQINSVDGAAQPKEMSKSMVAFRKTWGVEWVTKIFEAYSNLQVFLFSFLLSSFFRNGDKY